MSYGAVDLGKYSKRNKTVSVTHMSPSETLSPWLPLSHFLLCVPQPTPPL